MSLQLWRRRRPTTRAAVVGAALTIAAAGLIAPAVGHAATTDSSAGACTWLARTDPDVVNAAYPDQNATYWALAYAAVPGTKLVIHGTYAEARYFSFHVYGPSGVALDSIYDSEIKPDAGSQNPYSGPVKPSTGRSYTVTVDYSAEPSHPAPNTIYSDEAGLLLYRVYVPTDSSSLQGGVPLPSATVETTTGTPLVASAGCETPQPSTHGEINSVVNSLPVATNTGTTSSTDPVWGRVVSSKYFGLFGNQQNAYLSTKINQSDGQIVVIHARAMSFPNTSAGVPAWTPSQVRYWSICENSATTRYIACAADYQIPKPGHEYTIVISPKSAKPSNATIKNGVKWLPFGPQANGVVLFRNMVSSPGFAHAAADVPGGGDAAKVMGAYYPKIGYCSTKTFESGGWKACLA